MTPQEFADYFDSIDTDAVVYMGPIDRIGYNAFTDVLPKTKRKKLLLVLGTYGGDPHAGYRIARAAIHYYGSDNFSILIPAFCKSAGTLICIGASELIMFDKSELGPLDVQIQKRDEMFQLSSGLDIMRGMSYLQMEALDAFNSYLIEINGGSGLSTTIASDISSKLVTGLYEPLFAQIDPIKLGEMSAALQIANEYGTRLDQKSKALKPQALKQLIHDYPAHGFVIDRAEARTLFKKVEKPNDPQTLLGNFVYQTWSNNLNSSKPLVLDLAQLVKNFIKETQNVDTKQTGGSHGAPGDSAGVESGPKNDGSMGQPEGEPPQEQPSVGNEQADARPDEGTAQIE